MCFLLTNSVCPLPANLPAIVLIIPLMRVLLWSCQGQVARWVGLPCSFLRIMLRWRKRWELALRVPLYISFYSTASHQALKHVSESLTLFFGMAEYSVIFTPLSSINSRRLKCRCQWDVYQTNTVDFPEDSWLGCAEGGISVIDQWWQGNLVFKVDSLLLLLRPGPLGLGF